MPVFPLTIDGLVNALVSGKHLAKRTYPPPPANTRRNHTRVPQGRCHRIRQYCKAFSVPSSSDPPSITPSSSSRDCTRSPAAPIRCCDGGKVSGNGLCPNRRPNISSGPFRRKKYDNCVRGEEKNENRLWSRNRPENSIFAMNVERDTVRHHPYTTDAVTPTTLLA